MTQFIIGFVVYTLGTIGLLLLGYIGVKYFLNSLNAPSSKHCKNYLQLESAITIEPRKAVYILKAGNQRFLVATTPENVSFLAELNKDNVMAQAQNEYSKAPAQGQQPQNKSMPQMHPDLQAKLKYTNFIRDAISNQVAKR
jgi:flagellar biogenesis protein FliO